jgi:hypothetical protein
MRKSDFESGSSGGEADKMQENLTVKQRRAVMAVLTEPDLTAAARKAGASRDTLYRWLEMPAFNAALRAAEADAIAAVSRTLVRLAARASETLLGAMEDDDAPLGVRVRAAATVFENLLRLRELVALEERVRKLEEQWEDGRGFFRTS